MDKLSSGKDILFCNVLGCPAWKYKGAILFLKGIVH